MSHSIMNYFRRAQNELSTTNSAFQKYFIRITRPNIYFSSMFSRLCRVRPSPVSSNPNSVQVLQSRFQVLPGRTHVMRVPEYFGDQPAIPTPAIPTPAIPTLFPPVTLGFRQFWLGLACVGIAGVGIASGSIWISPAFDSVDDLQKTKSSKTLCVQSVSSFAGKKHAVAYQSDELWFNKYSPRIVDELAVHKNKVADIRHWFLTALSSCPPSGKFSPMLLMTGDTGTGKTAVVRVIAKELQVEVKEWVNMDTIMSASVDSGIVDFDMKTALESQLSKFSSFLLRASRYTSLGLSGGHTSDQAARHIILVEDFPNVFLHRPALLHNVLRQYHLHGLCPVIFIISECAGSRNERLLFPKSVLDELKIDTMYFNPVAATVAFKVLAKIAEQESAVANSRVNVPARDTLQLLVKANQGDIRAAINALQFYCQGNGCKKPVKHKAQRSMTTRNNEVLKSRSNVITTGKALCHVAEMNVDGFTACSGKDSILSLFHTVGKILHCKRQSDEEITEHLPVHLSNFRRKELLVNPEDAVEKARVSAELLVAFLHQNYVEFHTNIDTLVTSSSYLSESDCLADWATRSTLQSYVISIATRGLLFGNVDKADSGAGWKPINKPKWFAVVKEAADNCLKVKDLFSLSRLSVLELNTELIPFIAISDCSKRIIGEAKWDFARYIGTLTKRHTEFKHHNDDDLLVSSGELVSEESPSQLQRVKIPNNFGEGCSLVLEFDSEELNIDDSD